MAGASIDVHVEKLLMKADRQVLRILSPRARCIILALRMIRMEGTSIEELLMQIESYGFKCSKLEDALYMLSYHDIIECDDKLCRLTDAGVELSTALRGFLENMRSLAYNVVDGVAAEDDILASLVTAFASTVGLIESYAEEPSLMPLYLSLHMYITGLSTAVLAQLARVSAQVLDTVKRFTEGYETE